MRRWLSVAIPGREMSRYRSLRSYANIYANIRSKNTSAKKHFVLEIPSYTSSFIKSLLIAIIFINDESEGKKTFFFSLPSFFFSINHLPRFWTKPWESQEFNVAANFPRYRSLSPPIPTFFDTFDDQRSQEEVYLNNGWNGRKRYSCFAFFFREYNKIKKKKRGDYTRKRGKDPKIETRVRVVSR